MAAAAAVALAGVAAVALAGTMTHLLSPSVALAAPSSVDGLPRLGDQSPPASSATMGPLHLVDVVSATYGTDAVHYVLIAISVEGVTGDHLAIVQALTPQVVGDETVEPGSRTVISRDGVAFTCWRTQGTIAGAECSWTAGRLTGTVVQVGSDDVGRAAEFAAASRRALGS